MVYMSRATMAAILAVCILGILYALPNVLPQSLVQKMQETLPGWAPVHTVSLGLDLQGGAHLLLGVKLDVARQDRLESIRQEIRSRFAAAKPQRIGYGALNVLPGAVQVTLTDANDADRARQIVREINPDLTAEANGTDLRIRLTDEAARRRDDEVVAQSVEVVRRRVDEMGTKEPTIQRQGTDRILVQVPGVTDVAQLIKTLSPTAKLSFQMVDTAVSADQWNAGTRPAGDVLMQSREQAGEQLVVKKEVLVGGEMLSDAQATFNEGRAVVSFALDNTGSRRFCEVTQANIGKPFAIVLDNQVISAPRINSAICQGSGIITGNFTAQTAGDLALLLRAGALPAPLEVKEQRTVSASLGADAIHSGVIATLVGLALVIVFMLLGYGFFGLLADISMLINLALLVALMTALQATLTLPGIAGIVLTMGMAVDANVLINERIRDEVRAGRSPIAAIDTGFRGALGAIVDSNVTHLIASFLMFALGSGPVKGFAVALALGVLTSLFTSVTVTRLLVISWLRATKPKTLPV